MPKTIHQLYQEYYQLLSEIPYDGDSLDYSVLNKHVKYLDELSIGITGSASIFDMYKKDHVYLSDKFEDIFGWDMKRAKEEGLDYIDSRIHPDDGIELLECGIAMITMMLPLDPAICRDYKMVADYRVMNARGDYVRVIEQHTLLEFDKNGYPWLALAVMDLSPYTDIQSPYRSRLINFKTGQVFLFPPQDKEKMSRVPLTSREKEVLQLISQGLVSKEIADKLYISVNTVNTHRQRIIEKLNVSNTAEAVKYAAGIGIIGPASVA